MPQTFQSRIQISSIILLVLLLALAIYFMWNTNGLMIAITLFLMCVVIEQIIHTEYRIADGILTIHRGRLMPEKRIEISSILRIERINRLRIGGHTLKSYIFITCANGQIETITPKNIDDFIAAISKIKNKE